MLALSFELHHDELAAQVAALDQRVGVDAQRVVIVGARRDRTQEVGELGVGHGWMLTSPDRFGHGARVEPPRATGLASRRRWRIETIGASSNTPRRWRRMIRGPPRRWPSAFATGVL